MLVEKVDKKIDGSLILKTQESLNLKTSILKKNKQATMVLVRTNWNQFGILKLYYLNYSLLLRNTYNVQKYFLLFPLIIYVLIMNVEFIIIIYYILII